MAWTTTALVKTYLQITTNADDTLIDTLITRGQTFIESYTHRKFEASSDTTMYFDSYRDIRGRTLFFGEGLELAQNPTTVTNGDSAVLVVNTNFTMAPVNSFPSYAMEILASSSLWWTTKSNGDSARAISVLGRWAYSTVAPSDVVAALIRLVSFFYRQRESNADIDRPVMVQDGMVLMPGRIPSDIAAMLEPYRMHTP